MSIKVSVVVVTARVGCFDVLVNSFLAQTMPQGEFEVIIVDSLYEERKQFVKDKLPFNFIHVGLEGNREHYDACYANNTGFRMCRGELVVPFSDCNWASSTSLEDHWRIYKNYPGYSMMGYCDRFPIPRIKQPTEVDGQLVHEMQNVAWSIFQHEFSELFASMYFTVTEPTYRERRGGLGVDFKDGLKVVPGDVFYISLNESVPLQVIKDIGGLDEAYDGGYGISDIDFGLRANIAGWQFLLNPNSVNYKLGQQGNHMVIPGKSKPRIRPPEENYKYFQDKIAKIRLGELPIKPERGLQS
jgi:hypothetical protein